MATTAVAETAGRRPAERCRDRTGSHTDGIRLKLTYHASGYLKAIHRTDNGIQTLATYEQDARGRLTEADARLDYHLFYEYDAADRIIRWSDNDQTWSRFTYDAQGRCVNVTGAEGYYNATLDYGDGCTTVTDGKGIHRYYYDPDGNILREEAPDGSTTTYEWDEFHHLLARHSPEQWEYRHDASGRRTEKRCDRKKIRFTYLWDGDSIAEIREYRDDKLYSVRHLVFNGFELISQQFSRVRQPHPSVAPLWVTRTNHAVSDLTGRPLMLFNSEGKTVWRPGQTSLWGLALSLPADTGYPDPRGELDPEAAPGLLYAGQWQDAESGLCYNRFRYYEPESGMYLVSDPLGLLGGEQTYRYGLC